MIRGRKGEGGEERGRVGGDEETETVEVGRGRDVRIGERMDKGER